MKIKSVIRKTFNPLLLILASVSLFVHYFFSDDRNAWYCRDLEKNISIILIMIFIYRTREYRDGLPNKLYKCAFGFIFLKCSFNIDDELLAWIYNIHIHKELLIVQSIPLSIICFLAICYLSRR